MSPRTAWQLIWLLCALPLADLVFRSAGQQLGANPQEAILRATGLWSLTLLGHTRCNAVSPVAALA